MTNFKLVTNKILACLDTPPKILIVLIFILLITALPYSAPLLTLLLIGYGVGVFLGTKGTKSIAMGIGAWLGIFVPLGHLIGKADLYGREYLIIVILLSLDF